jgi:hypothetical protein
MDASTVASVVVAVLALWVIGGTLWVLWLDVVMEIRRRRDTPPEWDAAEFAKRIKEED